MSPLSRFAPRSREHRRGERIINVALHATARKSNHPVLWLLFGAMFAFVTCLAITTGSTGLIFSYGFLRLEPVFVTFRDAPIGFVCSVLAWAVFAIKFLTIGAVGWFVRLRYPNYAAHFTGVVTGRR